MTTPFVSRRSRRARPQGRWRVPQLLRKRDINFLVRYLFALGVLAAFVWFVGFDWSSVLIR